MRRHDDEGYDEMILCSSVSLRTITYIGEGAFYGRYLDAYVEFFCSSAFCLYERSGVYE